MLLLEGEVKNYYMQYIVECAVSLYLRDLMAQFTTPCVIFIVL